MPRHRGFLTRGNLGLLASLVEQVAQVGEVLKRAVAGRPLHTIEGADFGLQLGGVVIGRLDGEADAAFVLVDLDDAGGDHLADLEDVLDLFDVFFADLGDVDQTVDFVGEFDEGTEVSDFGDLALNDVADAVLAVDFLPWVIERLLDAEGNALLVGIDIEHDGFYVITLLEHFTRVVDAASPAHVRDVHHAVDAFFEFDEGTEVGQVSHLAMDAGTRWIVVADHIPRIGFELADTEGNFLFAGVDAEDDGFDFLADLENFARFGDALGPREFGDVHQTLDALFDFDEGTVVDQVDHLALDAGADRELALNVFPRVGGALLQAEGDALAVAIDLDDHHFDFLAHLEHFARVGDAAPAHVGDVEQAVETVEVDKGTVVGDVFDHALANDARLDLFEEDAAFFLALFLDQLAARNDDVFALGVDFEDFEIVGLADVLIQILGGLDVDLGGRHEGVNADGDDEATFDLGLDTALDDGAFRAVGNDVFPVFLLLGFVEGNDRAAVAVLEFFEEDFNFRAQLQFADVGKFVLGDDALGFAADIDNNVVLANFRDDALDD